MTTLPTNNSRAVLLKLVRGAAVAALYALFTLAIAPISSGLMQLRLSEGLCVLPYFAPEMAIGLFVGCAAANMLTGAMWFDVVFGSLATLIGAYGTYLLRRKPYLAALPPIISNTLIIPFLLAFVYKFDGSLWYFVLTVGIGEIISCGIFGTALIHCMLKRIKTR